METDPRGARADAFAAAFRDAINARRLTLARLHEQLRARGNSVSMATLSYWRSGARRPEGAQSLAALVDIEQLLDLDDGTLTRLLGASNRTGPLGPVQFPVDAEDLERAVRAAYAALGARYPNTSREVTTHSVSDVDAEGNVAVTTIRSVVQSTTGTVTGIPFLEMTPGVRSPAPIVSAVSGGRISRHYSDPQGEVHGGLFELDHPLSAPDTAVVEWSVEYPPGYPPTRDTGHAVSRQCRELLLWTRFHPDALPDWLEERVETPSGLTVTPLTLDGRTSVHQVRRAFGPGTLSLHWGYGEHPA
ncbi:hypothetical protein MHM582_0304 [Microbacterium sp. HM58-2]|nr:hypothetical protein MHM582_0304 [Microbacterium sp. HM58-2]